MKICWIIANRTAGGIGPVCIYAAKAAAAKPGVQATILSLHDTSEDTVDPASGVIFSSLGSGSEYPMRLLEWLERSPQDVVITSDVSHAEPAFPHFPKDLVHVIQLHDSGKRYRQVAIRNHKYVDGIVCVARHIEGRISSELSGVGYQGFVGTVHNGAEFPPLLHRQERPEVIRLLFMGRVEPLKGITDFAPILKQLKKLQVPAALTIVGGCDDGIARVFNREPLKGMVHLAGFVPHAECYEHARNSDILLMTSRKEPFGMVTIEAMSMGCVPIGYDVPSGTTEIIKHMESGVLVPLGDTRAIARNIGALHQNRSLLQKLSKGAIARARETFTSGNMADHLMEFLSGTIATRATRTPERIHGIPRIGPAATHDGARRYQRLSPVLRDMIRNSVASRARLCHWWLDR